MLTIMKIFNYSKWHSLTSGVMLYVLITSYALLRRYGGLELYELGKTAGTARSATIITQRNTPLISLRSQAQVSNSMFFSLLSMSSSHTSRQLTHLSRVPGCLGCTLTLVTIFFPLTAMWLFFIKNVRIISEDTHCSGRE